MPEERKAYPYSAIFSHMVEVDAKVFDEVNKCVQTCTCYRSLEQTPCRPLSLGCGWPPAQNIYEARDSLTYRSASLRWHVDLIRELQEREAQKIFEQESEFHLDPNSANRAMARLGFVFDDLIFNAVSMFDYLSKLICRIEFPKKKSQQLDWRKLALDGSLSKLEHPHLAGLIRAIHDGWFKGLDRLRSEIIHNRAAVGGLTHSTVNASEGRRYEIEFFVPGRALELVESFSGQEKMPLDVGAAFIATQSLQYVLEVVRLMDGFEYKCMHDPLQKGRMKKN